MADTYGGSLIQPFNYQTTPAPATVANVASPTYNVSAPADPYAGSLYFNTNTGQMESYNGNGNYGAVPADIAPTYNANPTHSYFTADGKQVGSQAELDAYNGAVANTTTGRDNIFNTASGTASNSVLTGRNSILDTIDSLRTGQQGVDNSRVNIQRSLQHNVQGAQQMVGNGIKSGGVMLSNKNAVDSSATGEIARAYGVLGNRQIQSGNNDAINKNAEVDLQQTAINNSKDKAKRDLDTFKTTTVDNIVRQAQIDLATLDAQAQGAGIGQRFQIEQEKNRIKDAATAKLGELDTLLATESSKIGPADNNTIMSKATEANNAGMSGGDMFNFSQDAPMNFAGGATNTGLPIYTQPRKRV